MSQIKSGIQLYSLKKALTKDFLGTIDKVADIGFTNVSMYFESPYLARFDVPCPARVLKDKLDSRGLRMINTHVVYHPFLNWDEVILYNQQIGSGGITIPSYLYNRDINHTKPEEAHALCKWLNEMGKKCNDCGLRLYYHNYFNEFEIFDGKFIYDILLENTDPASLAFELDVYWAWRGGLDPVAALTKVGQRCEILETMDLRADAKNVNLVAVDGAFDNAFFPKLHTHYGDYTEVGTGVLDFPAIFRKAKELGSVQYAVSAQVEAGAKGEFQSARENFAAIEKLIKG
jgi:sugar phosphate isomerase/epimerase